MNRTVTFQAYLNTLDTEAEQRISVSDISERGVERDSWSGVIIKCSEHGGEIFDGPLRSHTLPDTATQMWLFVKAAAICTKCK